jgi:hypothetical protein
MKMQKLEKLWYAIEKMSALKAIRARWQEYAQHDYSILEMILRPTSDQSFSYPCHMENEGYCLRTVIREKNKIFAVCSNFPKCCNKISLREEDIIIYECDYRKLSGFIAAALAINSNFSKTPCMHSFRIGSLNSNNNIPVYLTLINDTAQLQNTITTIYATISTPFILLFPTHNLVTHAVEALFKSTGCIGIVLADIVGRDEAGHFMPLYALEKLLPDYIVRKPIPAGLDWHDITMQFRDGHTIYIMYYSVHMVVNFTQLGMVNTKNGEPTKQWGLLQVFSQCGGKLSWDNAAAHFRLQKQKELLSKKLQEFFGINDEPIVWKKKERCYVTRFNILPERG